MNPFSYLARKKIAQIPIPDFGKITISSGAGISAESGLKTFRGEDGLWEGHSIYEVCRPEGFLSNPKLVLDFYNRRRKECLYVKPNAAHKALSDLEQRLEGKISILTQNVDNLHERAGSKNVIHVHGKLFETRCHYCDLKFPDLEPIPFPNVCPACKRTNSLRPAVVFFKEYPQMGGVGDALKVPLFISIGTSGNVYPAAGFIQDFKNYPAFPKQISVEINPSQTAISELFDYRITGAAGKMVPILVEYILSIRQP